jgi:hypothetical protein
MLGIVGSTLLKFECQYNTFCWHGLLKGTGLIFLQSAPGATRSTEGGAATPSKGPAAEEHSEPARQHHAESAATNGHAAPSTAPSSAPESPAPSHPTEEVITAVHT